MRIGEAVAERATRDLADALGRSAARLFAAEDKLAELRSVLLEGGQDDTTARRRALAIIGSEEESADGR
jgi:hypothetical protein